jgi:hypothetical protein
MRQYHANGYLSSLDEHPSSNEPETRRSRLNDLNAAYGFAIGGTAE